MYAEVNVESRAVARVGREGQPPRAQLWEGRKTGKEKLLGFSFFLGRGRHSVHIDYKK